jgi:uncharacterized protein (TIGR00255 family)
LDVSLKLPREYIRFEPELRKIVSSIAHRGRLDVSLTRKGPGGAFTDIVFDKDLASAYYKSLLRMKEEFSLAGEISVSDMLSLGDILQPVEKADAVEQEWPVIERCLREAMTGLDAMRTAEGAALWKDVDERLLNIRETARQIAPIVGQVTIAAKERLERRVQDLAGGLDLDPERLAQEIAILAERSDITEELTRLESHVDQFLGIGKAGSPVGRKLDFLLQEMLREVNTVASKSSSTDIAGQVVNIKAEIEKIREQTQNIE